MTDVDYLTIFHRVILPIAHEVSISNSSNIKAILTTNIDYSMILNRRKHFSRFKCDFLRECDIIYRYFDFYIFGILIFITDINNRYFLDIYHRYLHDINHRYRYLSPISIIYSIFFYDFFYSMIPNW